VPVHGIQAAWRCWWRRSGWDGRARRRDWLERSGIAQKRGRYPNSPNAPTATCHLQPADNENALCGYQWEGLIAAPGQPEWSDLEDWLPALVPSMIVMNIARTNDA